MLPVFGMVRVVGTLMGSIMSYLLVVRDAGLSMWLLIVLLIINNNNFNYRYYYYFYYY